MCSYYPKEIVASYFPDNKTVVEYKKISLTDSTTKIVETERKMTDEKLSHYSSSVEDAKIYTRKLLEDFMSHLEDFK